MIIVDFVQLRSFFLIFNCHILFFNFKIVQLISCKNYHNWTFEFNYFFIAIIMVYVIVICVCVELWDNLFLIEWVFLFYEYVFKLFYVVSLIVVLLFLIRIIVSLILAEVLCSWMILVTYHLKIPKILYVEELSWIIMMLK